MKYDDLTNRFAKWLFPLIDRVDCGYKHEDGSPRPFHTSAFLTSRGHDYPPRKVTRTFLQAHLRDEETFYYRSRRRSGFVLAMIDVDAHEGQTDAQAVADWLVSTYFPQAYCEPSTHGRGRHVYAVLRVGDARPWVVNAALSETAEALALLARQGGFKSTVCGIYGTYTLWITDDSGERTIGKRGSLGKVPRLSQGLDSFRRLVSAPVFLMSSLVRAVDDAAQHRRVLSLSPSCTKASTSESPPSANVNASVKPPPCTKPSTSEPSDNPKLNDLRDRALSTTNPLARMRLASSLFYHQHGRYAADEQQLVEFYEANGMNTDEDRRGRRLERARIALERHRATERRWRTKGYDASDYLPMIHQNVTQAARTHPAVKYRYAVGDDLLAAGLYAYTKAAFATNRTDRMHSLSDEGLKAMFETLASGGAVNSKFGDKEKRVAVRQMLQLAGLIVLRDGDHVHGGREHGVADKWGLGPSHVRFAEFVKAYGHVVDPRSLPQVAEQTGRCA